MINSRLEEGFLELSSEVLRAIAHPIRIAIIDLLHNKGKLSVTEIHQNLDIEQAIASHHLRILKDKQILFSKREGKNTYYDLRAGSYAEIIGTLEKVLK
ncbi:MAG: metalloregulator ArsR/SmtB family transcription factor [Bacteroidota bacterium]